MRRTSVKGLVYAPEASNVARVGVDAAAEGTTEARARGRGGVSRGGGGGEVSSRVLERGARERRRERGAGRDASRRGRRGRGTDPAACDDDDFARAASGRGDRARAARGSARDRVDAERRAERAAGEPPERRRRGEHPVARERTGRVGALVLPALTRRSQKRALLPPTARAPSYTRTLAARKESPSGRANRSSGFSIAGISARSVKNRTDPVSKSPALADQERALGPGRPRAATSIEPPWHLAPRSLSSETASDNPKPSSRSLVASAHTSPAR